MCGHLKGTFGCVSEDMNLITAHYVDLVTSFDIYAFCPDASKAHLPIQRQHNYAAVLDLS